MGKQEKTVIITSMIFHNYNWIAAGNLNGFNTEKSGVLQNKTVILYSDVGCYDHWIRKAEQINHDLSLHLTVSNFLENFASPQQTRYGYDLVAYIIEQLIFNGAGTTKTS
jgi:hypothetical protein